MASSSRLATLAAMAIAIAAVAHDAAAQVYKCKDASGKTTYQQRPCDGGAAETNLAPGPAPARASAPVSAPASDPASAPPSAPASAPAPAPAPAPASAPTPTRDEPSAAAPNVPMAPPAAPLPPFDPALAKLIVAKRGCDERLPGFSQKVAADYTRWRQKNLQRVVVTERSPEFAQQMDDARKLRAAAKTKPSPADIAKECDGVVAFLEQNAGPSDARFATPEGTWRVFTDALRKGNAVAALRCMAGTARDGYQLSFAKMQAKGMRDFAITLRSLRVTHTGDTDGRGVISKVDGTESRVSFEKIGAEWRIVDL